MKKKKVWYAAVGATGNHLIPFIVGNQYGCVKHLQLVHNLPTRILLQSNFSNKMNICTCLALHASLVSLVEVGVVFCAKAEFPHLYDVHIELL